MEHTEHIALIDGYTLALRRYDDPPRGTLIVVSLYRNGNKTDEIAHFPWGTAPKQVAEGTRDHLYHSYRDRGHRDFLDREWPTAVEPLIRERVLTLTEEIPLAG